MSQFLQATLYGLLQGGLLALVAVGFSLVWGVMNVVNLAHGAFVVIGAYVAWELKEALGLDPFLGMAVAAAALFVAVFPANVHMALHPERYRVPGGRAALYARLPLQGAAIAWALAAGRVRERPRVVRWLGG
jgi:branched-subunit amino acid ABC-type transport system permease component